MALNSLFCADVPLSNYSLTHSELFMLKVGVSYTPDCKWTRAQIDCMLTAVDRL